MGGAPGRAEKMGGAPVHAEKTGGAPVHAENTGSAPGRAENLRRVQSARISLISSSTRTAWILASTLVRSSVGTVS
jgi:hypothetical protein